MENPIKMDDLGVPLFSETLRGLLGPILGPKSRLSSEWNNCSFGTVDVDTITKKVAEYNKVPVLFLGGGLGRGLTGRW